MSIDGALYYSSSYACNNDVGPEQCRADVDSVTKLKAITSAKHARCVLNMCAPTTSSAGPTACNFVHMAAVFDQCKSDPDDLLIQVDFADTGSAVVDAHFASLNLPKPPYRDFEDRLALALQHLGNDFAFDSLIEQITGNWQLIQDAGSQARTTWISKSAVAGVWLSERAQSKAHGYWTQHQTNAVNKQTVWANGQMSRAQKCLTKWLNR